LARRFLPAGHANYFDLEDPSSRRALAQPMTALAPLQGLTVVDEVQHAPELFRVLRVLIDRDSRPGQYLLLGSASPVLLRQTSETLLGRVEVIEIAGFDLQETGVRSAPRLWLRGGYPPAYTAADDVDANVWCNNAIARFVQSDLPQFGVNVAAPAMMRFWAMLAHVHGQTWNAADPARSLGVSEPTVRRYLDWLTQGFMVRQLQPWFENLGKRQVKAPKIYFPDTGFLHALLGVRNAAELARHPRSGARRRAGPHAVDAHRHGRPRSRRAVRGVPRRAALPARRAHRSRAAGALRRRPLTLATRRALLPLG
jgi:uncharacterized protein